MAQLFTIYFPKYHFDFEKEFTVEIHKIKLPFEYVIENGKCYVGEVFYNQDNEGDPRFWRKKGLQEGLRIIEINNVSLMDENDDGNLSKDIEELLSIVPETETFIFRFRREVSTEDYSIPLGLGYNEEDQKDYGLLNYLFHDDEKLMSSQTSLSPRDSNSTSDSIQSKDAMETNLFERIEDSQIGASSFEKGYEPSQGRLNNPISFWQPSGDDQTTLDTWLRIDLGKKKMVTKLHLQGSLDHSSFVRSFWIDYSDDCCQWKSHPLGEIKCKYKKYSLENRSSLILKSLNSIVDKDDDDTNIYAEIIIWPAITARFIRIRPYTVENKVAVRLELYGFKQIVTAAHLSFARVVTLYDVSETDKKKLMEQVTNLPANTKLVQVDCKALISAALDRSRLRYRRFLNVDEHNCLCVFTASGAGASERALDELSEVGVGTEIGVISTTAVAFLNESLSGDYESMIKQKQEKKGQKFSESVKSRKAIQQVIKRIMNSTALTFDYICMLIVASLIASGGLATDNAVVVVASMLVSPLMGPVLAFTFGVALEEINMAILGLKNQLLSILICVITGFIVGFLYPVLSKNSNNWPTEEMSSRGTIEGLFDSTLVAAASGVAVTLSILGEYLSTVIGVAISASVLPPAVNCGMLLAFPLFTTLYPEWIPLNKGYANKKELLSMAGYSLLLTMVNIIIIVAVSRFMCWIKNVYITKDHNQEVWKSVASTRASSMRNLLTNRHQS